MQKFLMQLRKFLHLIKLNFDGAGKEVEEEEYAKSVRNIAVAAAAVATTCNINLYNMIYNYLLRIISLP